MAKKSKKKTLASTRKKSGQEKQEAVQKEVKKKEKKPSFLARLRTRKEQKAAEKKLKAEQKKQAAAEEKKAEKAAEKEAAKAEKALQETSERERDIVTESRAPKKKARLTRRHKQTIKGGFLVMIGLFALTFIGSFLFGKFFRPQSLAELLPAESALAFLEVNVDGADQQTRQFYELLERYPVYRRENIIRLVDFYLPVEFERDIEPWLGRRVGAALLADRNNNNRPDYVFFIETREQAMALEYLKKQVADQARDELVSVNKNGVNIYSYKFSHSFSFAFLNNYLVLSPNDPLLESVVLAYTGNGKKLSQEENYIKVSNNLPHGGLLFGYAGLGGYFDAMAYDQAFMVQKGRYLGALKPFLNIFKAAGISVFADKNKFTAQTFVTINNADPKQAGYVTFENKYQGDLLAYAPQEPVFFAGGHNLTGELNKLEEIFGSGANSSSLIFNGLLEARKQQYFGKEISLKNDIYPLLRGEYLLSVENSLEKPVFSLILQMTDPKADQAAFDKILAAFVKTAGIWTSHTRSVTLPDGTVGQEIVSLPEQIIRSDEDYRGATLSTLRLGETSAAIYTAVAKDKIVIGSDRDSTINIITQITGEAAGLSSTERFEKNIKPLLTTADEMFSLKLGALTAAAGLDQDELIKNYLLPFSDLTVAKNYFTDGISTIYYLGII